MVVTSNSLLYSAYSLLFTFLGVTGLYIFLWADFLAVVQVVVYLGGILVLIIFGIWILNERGLVAVVMEGDKSKISMVIATLWIFSSIYWLYLSKVISSERSSFEGMDFSNKKLVVSKFFNSLKENENKDVLINAFESEFEKKISYGVIASDIALKLGLSLIHI